MGDTAIGTTLIVFSLIYGIVNMLFFGVDLLSNPLIWVALGAAIIVGIAGGINVLETGLNSTGTKLSFISSIAIALYAVLLLPTIGNTGIPDPYGMWLSVGISVCYAMGFFLLMAES